ncbi:MAG: ABC transporter ATP-binding protein [Pseudomonadota bacterium]
MTAPFSSKFGKLTRSFAVWGKVLALLRYSSRRLGVQVFALTFLEIALTVGALFAVKSAVETLSVSTGTPGNMVLHLALILGLFLASRVAQAVGNYYRAAQGYVVSDYVNQAIQERAVAADLSFYDSALYHDSLERARQAGAGRPAQVTANALNAFRSGLMLAAIAVIIITIEWLLLPFSLVAVALVLLVQLRFTRERFEMQRALVQKERGALYADYLMTAEPFAKEIRLWDMGAFLRDLYMKLRMSLRKDYLAVEWRKSKAEVGIAIVGTALFCAAAAAVVWRLDAGQATISDLVILVLLLLRAEIAGRDFVSSVSRLHDDRLFLTQMFDFLDLQPVIQRGGDHKPMPTPTDAGVVLENVSFRYPASDRLALDSVSLQLKSGRFTALVGGNGSGKTTLIKLLCRLYDPQDGRITLYGQDIRDLDPIRYRQEFSVIFQDFVQFAFSGRDNLIVSGLGAPGQEEQMLRAAKMTGADDVLQALPKGYDTILSRMFDDGVELSGGQWQKVALARSVFPKSSFVVLDEPTSAIDPNAEADLFDGFRDKLDGRGALVISHRLSTIRMADYTYVLDEGRIVEEGTHEELIAKNGHYAGMFERQGRGYRR